MNFLSYVSFIYCYDELYFNISQKWMLSSDSAGVNCLSWMYTDSAGVNSLSWMYIYCYFLQCDMLTLYCFNKLYKIHVKLEIYAFVSFFYTVKQILCTFNMEGGNSKFCYCSSNIPIYCFTSYTYKLVHNGFHKDFNTITENGFV